ncbi:MAG: hypothetical protein ACOVOT_06925 [Rubrivivax sp.]|nr:hypothetical protein [Rubrivivax sp.]
MSARALFPFLSLRRPRRDSIRASTLGDSSALRTEVCPPSMVLAPAGLWDRVLFWLLSPASQRSAPSLRQLDRVRQDFADQLADLAGDMPLHDQVGRARSLRELWHLRMAAYTAIATAFDQAEAERRLAHLNRHFPTRSPRSGFAPL